MKYERNATRALHRRPVHKSFKSIQNHRLSSFERVVHRGRTQGLKSHCFDVRRHLREVASESRGQTSSSHTGENKVKRLRMRPFFEQLGCKAALPLDDPNIIEGMHKDRVCFLLELPGLSDRIVKGGADHHDIEPLAAVVAHAVYLQLGRGGRHEDRPPHPQLLATVSDPLSMVSGTRRHHPARLLLLCQVSESSGSTANLETSDRLQVLSFEIDVGLVLCGEVGGALERRMLNNLLVFSIGLVYPVGGDQLALPVGVRMDRIVAHSL